MLCAMRDLCRLIWWALVGLFRSRAALEAENLVLRQQINVLRRTGPKRPAFSRTDRLIFVGLCWLFPDVRAALAIIKPDTVIRWHRMGFRAYWRWKAKSRGGRDAPISRAVEAVGRILCLPILGGLHYHYSRI